MSGIARIGDMSTGHDHCYEPRPCIEGSDFVTVDGIGVNCVGDAWASHGGCRDHSPHGGVSSAGSSFVTIDGRAACRVGDPISCGDTIATGSDFVTVDV